MRLVHRSRLISGARGFDLRARSIEVCGERLRSGEGENTRAAIRGDLEKPSRRNGGDHFRAHNVPVAAPAVAAPFQSGRIRRSDPLSRMPRVSGARAPETREASRGEIPESGIDGSPAAAGNRLLEAGALPNPSSTTFHHSDIRAAGFARGALAQIASSPGARARARILQARGFELCPVSALLRSPPSCASQNGVKVPSRACKTSPRPARVASALRGLARRAGDLRRGSQSLLFLEVA